MVPQAMKVIRADLTAEGRLDILEKVMAYRGGLSIISFVGSSYSHKGCSGYSPQVDSCASPRNPNLMKFRTAAGSNVKRFPVNYSE